MARALGERPALDPFVRRRAVERRDSAFVQPKVHGELSTVMRQMLKHAVADHPVARLLVDQPASGQDAPRSGKVLVGASCSSCARNVSEYVIAFSPLDRSLKWIADRFCPRRCGRTGVMLETSARLLRLLALLQSRRYWSGVDLAAQLEVTTRTLRRDVNRLRDRPHGRLQLGRRGRVSTGPRSRISSPSARRRRGDGGRHRAPDRLRVRCERDGGSRRRGACQVRARAASAAAPALERARIIGEPADRVASWCRRADDLLHRGVLPRSRDSPLSLSPPRRFGRGAPVRAAPARPHRQALVPGGLGSCSRRLADFPGRSHSTADHGRESLCSTTAAGRRIRGIRLPLGGLRAVGIPGACDPPLRTGRGVRAISPDRRRRRSHRGRPVHALHRRPFTLSFFLTLSGVEFEVADPPELIAHLQEMSRRLGRAIALSSKSL